MAILSKSLVIAIAGTIERGLFSMTVGYDISLAIPNDISGILVLQEPNLPDGGGSLSVRLTEDWFRRTISEKSVVVSCRNGKVVGYVSGTSLAAKRMTGSPVTNRASFRPGELCTNFIELQPDR
jgi:hypothetical protein